MIAIRLRPDRRLRVAVRHRHAVPRRQKRQLGPLRLRPGAGKRRSLFQQCAHRRDHRPAGLGHADLPRSQDQRIQGPARHRLEMDRRQDARARAAPGRQVPQRRGVRRRRRRLHAELRRPSRRTRSSPSRTSTGSRAPRSSTNTRCASSPSRRSRRRSSISRGRSSIHPHEYYAKVGPKGMNEKPVGSGPYRVTEHALGKYVRHGAQPGLLQGQPEAAAEDRQGRDPLHSGRADPRRRNARRRPRPDHERRRRPGAAAQARCRTCRSCRARPCAIVFLQFNTLENSPRAAAARHPRAQGDHACDRPRGAWSSRSSAKARACCTRMCFPSQFGCTDEGAPRYAYDPAKAKQLLAEAGFPNGFDIDLYAYRERNQTEAMIGYLRAVGIRANLRFMQYAAMRDADARRQGAAGAPDLGLVLGQRRLRRDAGLLQVHARRREPRPGGARPAGARRLLGRSRRCARRPMPRRWR